MMAADRVGELADLGENRLEERAALNVASWEKRCLDILGAGMGLLFLAPFLTFVAVLIMLESPGPALFRQKRTGYRGRTFRIYKFRSMTVAEDGAVVRQAQKGDARITTIGAFLRKSSIDELPQLINVVKGEMSLVGPRPHAQAHDEYYSTVIPEYRDRFMVRPGITGLAQVMGYRGATPDIASMAARIERDVQYIRSWSVKMDVVILYRTVMLGPFDPAAYCAPSRLTSR
jgi:lipopolysaccharide/colanic/teichoic acid biosynthesis glycosyltransferase